MHFSSGCRSPGFRRDPPLRCHQDPNSADIRSSPTPSSHQGTKNLGMEWNDRVLCWPSAQDSPAYTDNSHQLDALWTGKADSFGGGTARTIIASSSSWLTNSLFVLCRWWGPCTEIRVSFFFIVLKKWRNMQSFPDQVGRQRKRCSLQHAAEIMASLSVLPFMWSNVKFNVIIILEHLRAIQTSFPVFLLIFNKVNSYFPELQKQVENLGKARNVTWPSDMNDFKKHSSSFQQMCKDLLGRKLRVQLYKAVEPNKLLARFRMGSWELIGYHSLWTRRKD